MVQESPVVYRNILGRKTKRILENLPDRRAAQAASIQGWPSNVDRAPASTLSVISLPSNNHLFSRAFFFLPEFLIAKSTVGHCAEVLTLVDSSR